MNKVDSVNPEYAENIPICQDLRFSLLVHIISKEFLSSLSAIFAKKSYPFPIPYCPMQLKTKLQSKLYVYV